MWSRCQYVSNRELPSPFTKVEAKDPLDVNSYRGITLNSVISKVLESLILDRLESLWKLACHTKINQLIEKECPVLTRFLPLKVISRYLQEGGKVYMCLYDLQKAFGSVEFPVLLKRLFDVGVNLKIWLILRSWYANCQSSVRLGQHISPSFALPSVVVCDSGPSCHQLHPVTRYADIIFTAFSSNLRAWRL